LSEFLMQRAARSPKLANFFYWYLKVETGNTVTKPVDKADLRNGAAATGPSQGARYRVVLAAFMERELPASEQGVEIKASLERGSQLVELCRYGFKATAEIRGSAERKLALRELLTQHSANFLTVTDVEELLIPVQPEWSAISLEPSQASIWASANAPLKIVFQCSDGETRAVMYKAGDDLRQDQLVLQAIRLCDHLLKRENVDLELITYGTLATDMAEGLIELVPSSLTLYEITKEYTNSNNSILSYLESYNPHPDDLQQAIERYLKSLAGFCVITYLLCVGDRHLENLMLASDGRLFHIDFGYILGRKPFANAAQCRITHEMIEAMGGASSEGFTRFLSFAKETFNCLRKHAGLIMRLLLMMGDAGIVNGNTFKDDFSPEYLHTIFEDRFWPSKSDEDAAAEFERILVDSPYVLGSRVHDFFHDLKVRNKG